MEKNVYERLKPFPSSLPPRTTQTTTMAIIMTNMAATTGTIRLRLDINSFNVSSVVRDRVSRAGAIVPEIHSHQMNLILTKSINRNVFFMDQ